MERSFWVPEHPTLPMYRAMKPSRTGKLGEVEHLLTASIHGAMQFPTREACEAWIVANPDPVFVARGHSIMVDMAEVDNYPIVPRPENDSRFTVGLLHDLIQVLARHGYGPLAGNDASHLQQAVFAFLYGKTER